MEVFLETNVPLLDTPEWAASTSTWPAVTPIIPPRATSRPGRWAAPGIRHWTGLRVRALQSRDVRAPNLAELYAGARVNNGS
jgi:hypothetical protein